MAHTDRATFIWLVKHTKGMRIKLGVILAGNALFGAVSVDMALLMRDLIDAAVDGNRGGIIHSGILLATVILTQFIIRISCNILSEDVQARMESRLRADILACLMRREYSALGDYHSGELLNRMFSDVSVVVSGVISIVPTAANNLVRIVFAAGVLLSLDWRFGIFFIAAGLFVFAATRFFRPKMKRLHTRVQECEGAVRSFLQETVENLLVVRVFSAEHKMLSRNDENQTGMYKARMKRSAFSVAANAGLGLAFGAGYIFALMWGAAGIYGGTMSYGTLTAVLQLVNQIQSPFAGLSSLFPRYFSMCASAERIIALEKLPEEKLAEKLLAAEDFRKIILENVSFSYGENHVLKNVGIEVEKGDFVSLTGISGGGKSTLFLLLLGAYSPDSGSVSFLSDGGSFSAGRETRPLFAYVPQGNLLFSGTIYENISFLNDNAGEDEVRGAAEIACAMEFIDALPDGMNTRVGENGFGLSEGQAQRIAVARAILGGAPILLLDEATSALDEQTEARLLKNISALDGKTVIIVTHRPAALKICTKHLLLKDGNISYGN